VAVDLLYPVSVSLKEKPAVPISEELTILSSGAHSFSTLKSDRKTRVGT
jgi:hypothetical protein